MAAALPPADTQFTLPIAVKIIEIMSVANVPAILPKSNDERPFDTAVPTVAEVCFEISAELLLGVL